MQQTARPSLVYVHQSGFLQIGQGCCRLTRNHELGARFKIHHLFAVDHGVSQPLRVPKKFGKLNKTLAVTAPFSHGDHTRHDVCYVQRQYPRLISRLDAISLQPKHLNMRRLQTRPSILTHFTIANRFHHILL